MLKVLLWIALTGLAFLVFLMVLIIIALIIKGLRK